MLLGHFLWSLRLNQKVKHAHDAVGRKESERQDLLHKPLEAARAGVHVHHDETPLLEVPPKSLAAVEETAFQPQAACIK